MKVALVAASVLAVAQARIYYITSPEFDDTAVTKDFATDETDADKKISYWASACSGTVAGADLKCDFPRTSATLKSASYTSVPSGCVDDSYLMEGQTGADCSGSSPDIACKATSSWKYSCRSNILYKQTYTKAGCATADLTAGDGNKDDCEADPTKDAFCGVVNWKTGAYSATTFVPHSVAEDKEDDADQIKYTGFSWSGNTGLCMEDDPVDSGFDSTMRAVLFQGFDGDYTSKTTYFNSMCGDDSTIISGEWTKSAGCFEIGKDDGPSGSYPTTDAFGNTWYKETAVYLKSVVNTTTMSYSHFYYTDATCDTLANQEFVLSGTVESQPWGNGLKAAYSNAPCVGGATYCQSLQAYQSDLNCHFNSAVQLAGHLDAYTSAQRSASDASLVAPAVAVLVPLVAAFL